MTRHDSTARTEPRRRLSAGSVIALVVGGVGLVTAGFVALSLMSGHPFGYFSKEPAETLHVPRIIGWQAYTIWWIEAAGAAVALFSAWIVRRYRGPGMQSSFLLAAGAFSCILLIDDMYQFHDYVLVRFFNLDERVVYAVYALVAAALVWRWGRHVARRDSSLVLVAMIAVAVSVTVDQVVDKTWPWFHVLEDGCKMLGFTLWAVFQIRTGARMVTALIEEPRTAAPPDVDPVDDGGADEADGQAQEPADDPARDEARDPARNGVADTVAVVMGDADADAVTRPLPRVAAPPRPADPAGSTGSAAEPEAGRWQLSAWR
ncbi:MAG: hypothetical protein AB7J32_23865 [Pseudonocardia sp.]